MHVSLIVPAPFVTVSGGYAYDRRIVAGLRALGHQVDVVELAGAFPFAARRAIRYGNGWIPRADRLEKDGVGVLIGKFRDMAREAGRDPASLPITIFRVPAEIDRLRFCEEVDIDRVVFTLPAEKEDKIMPILDRWTELKRQLEA